MSWGIIAVLLGWLTTAVHPFQQSRNIVNHHSSTEVVRNPFRFSTELLAKKKGSKLISDDFLSSLDQFDETPSSTKPTVATPAVVKTMEVVTEKEVFIDVASVEAKVEGEETDVVKKKKKKRDKSKKDYFSNVDLNDSKDEEAGKNKEEMQ
jgi:hypothetical protein